MHQMSTELALRAFEADASFSAALAEFQSEVPPGTHPIAAAREATAHGFSWLCRPTYDGMIEVRLRHCGGADAAAEGTCLVELLGGLLGVPLQQEDQAAEPESTMRETHQEPATPAAVVVTEAAPDAEIDAAAQSLAAATGGEVVELPDPNDLLDDQQKAVAVEAVKALDAEQRRAFTIAFRDCFRVPRTERSIIPSITKRAHLDFIDRFTVEAGGGISE